MFESSSQLSMLFFPRATMILLGGQQDGTKHLREDEMIASAYQLVSYCYLLRKG